MNTKSTNPQKIKDAFDEFFSDFTEQEKLESDARLLMFRFLEIIDDKREKLGWNRKQLAEQIGTSASYITQLYRGDKLVNMLTLAKFKKALGLEFEIAEKKDYADRALDYTPKGDNEGVWVYRKFAKPDYTKKEDLPIPKETICDIA